MGSVGLLADKAGLITGAGSGIGRACAELFVAEGATGLVVSDIDELGAQETVRRIAAAGERRPPSSPTCRGRATSGRWSRPSSEPTVALTSPSATPASVTPKAPFTSSQRTISTA